MEAGAGTPSGVTLPAAAVSGDASSHVKITADMSQAIALLSQVLGTAQQSLIPASLLGLLKQQPVIAAVPSLSLDLPPILAPLSNRETTVTNLLSAAGSSTWISIQDAASTGKSILARLTAQKLGGPIRYIDFNNLDDEAAGIRLDQACTLLTGSGPPALRDNWYRGACAALGEKAALVLDHLPDLSTSSQFLSRLAPLVKAAGPLGVRVISSSLHPLLLSLRTERGTVSEVAAPPLTDEEAADVMRAYGAPSPLVAEKATLVNRLAKRHPFLLVAACQFLQRKGWALGEGEINDLLGGAHTADFGTELYRKLQATVPDPESRELLYRLTLPGGRFKRGQMEALAAVLEPVPRPAERLADLVNAWVKRIADGEWDVSPLCERLAADYHDQATRRRCHDCLGGLVVGRGVMNQRDAHEAIVHFREAGEWGKAGSILMLILNEAWNAKADLRGEPVLALWAAESLPAEMDLNLRLMIRGLQVALFEKMGRGVEFVVADLEQLLAEADFRHKLGAAGAVSYAVSAVAVSRPTEANRFVRRYLVIAAQVDPSKRQRRRRARN